MSMDLTQMSRDELEALAGQIKTRIGAMDRLDEARDTAVAAVAAYATAAGVTVEQAWRDLAPEELQIPAPALPDAPEWVQRYGDNPYKVGDLVTYKGDVYENLWAGNTYTPIAYPQGWKRIT